jgi:hypothetical protein
MKEITSYASNTLVVVNDAKHSELSGAHGSRFFNARLSVLDGGDPIDLMDDEDGGTVMRGEITVGEGDDLRSAWDDYLYSVDIAPVSSPDLEAMWRQYDAADNEVSHAD